MLYQQENFGKKADFRCRIHSGDYIIDRHIHEYSEIFYLKSGNAKINVNNHQITVMAGYMVYIPPNYIHEYSCQNCEVICAVFSNDFVPIFFEKAGKNMPIPCAIDAKDLKNILYELPSVDASDTVLISGYLNIICDRILKSSGFSKAKNTDSVLYQKVIYYISEHYREKISLKSIAGHFGYNEKYLSASLFSLTGIHFTKFVATYRIGYAKELLKNTDLKISDIAYESGFSALNSFNRAFKEFTGITPYEYRCNFKS